MTRPQEAQELLEMKASKGEVVPCSDIYGVGIDLKSGGDTHYASITIYRESTQEAAELRDFIIDAINDKYSDDETGMNNRELIKELLTLSDEALKHLGYQGITSEHGRKVAAHYVNGGDIEYLGRSGKEPAFAMPADQYRIARKMIRVNGIEVPAPESEAPEDGAIYYLTENSYEERYNTTRWRGDDFDLRALKRGLVYLNTEDAIERAEAMEKFEEVE